MYGYWMVIIDGGCFFPSVAHSRNKVKLKNSLWEEGGFLFIYFFNETGKMKNDFLIYFWCRVSTKKSYIAYARAPVSFNTRPVGFPRFSWKILGHYNLKFNTSDLQAISQNFPMYIYTHRLSLNYNRRRFTYFFSCLP